MKNNLKKSYLVYSKNQNVFKRIRIKNRFKFR